MAAQDQPQLDTTAANALTLKTELLAITVLGGIKLEGLERLKATLKIAPIWKPGKPKIHSAIRDSLDLYQDDAVERIIRKVATRLEIGTTLIREALETLTEQLEAYRLGLIEKAIEANRPYIPRKLTHAEEKEAKKFLNIKELLKKTNELIGKSGVVGEVRNRLLMFLIFTSRKMNQPLHIISLGSSGLGKTHLQEKVAALIPEEDKLELTTLSENAFYYFERKALANKLILIEDLDGAVNSLYPLRELQSKKRISKTIANKDAHGNRNTKHLVVEGPVSVAGCTTKEKLYEDNANRSFLIYLDESAEQDQAIMDYQRKLAAGKIDESEQEQATQLLQAAQKVLEPVKVINPYAELLELPKEVFKPRRTNAHYLQFVAAVTFYHQKQREEKVDEETGEIYIETTPEDIAQANELLGELLLRKSDELSGACRNYLERLKLWIKTAGKEAFNNREARQALRVSMSQQKRYMIELQSLGLVMKAQKEGDKGNQKQGYYYRLVSANEYEQLKGRIDQVLDKVMEACLEQERKTVQQFEAVRSAEQTTLPPDNQEKKQAVRKVRQNGSPTKKKDTK